MARNANKHCRCCHVSQEGKHKMNIKQRLNLPEQPHFSYPNRQLTLATRALHSTLLGLSNLANQIAFVVATKTTVL